MSQAALPLLMLLLSAAYGIRADLTGSAAHKRVSSYWTWAAVFFAFVGIADAWGWL